MIQNLYPIEFPHLSPPFKHHPCYRGGFGPRANRPTAPGVAQKNLCSFQPSPRCWAKYFGLLAQHREEIFTRDSHSQVPHARPSDSPSPFLLCEVCFLCRATSLLTLAVNCRLPSCVPAGTPLCVPAVSRPPPGDDWHQHSLASPPLLPRA